jgi:hypothetical protein
MPRPEERYEIWQKTFPPQIAIADDIDWHSHRGPPRIDRRRHPEMP